MIFCPNQPKPLKEMSIPTVFLISPILLFMAVRLLSPLPEYNHYHMHRWISHWLTGTFEGYTRIHSVSQFHFDFCPNIAPQLPQTPTYSFNVLCPHIHIILPDIVNYRLFKLVNFLNRLPYNESLIRTWTSSYSLFYPQHLEWLCQ